MKKYECNFCKFRVRSKELMTNHIKKEHCEKIMTLRTDKEMVL